MFKCLLVELMMVLLPSGAAALPLQQDVIEEDTLSIRFRMDSIFIDMDYANNRQSWNQFEHNFRKHFSTKSPRALQLDIYSGASPEGPAKHNRWLGENRGEAIRWLVRKQMPGRVGRIVVHNEGARWEGLFEAVAASNEWWRDDVLNIIAQPATTDENVRDHREYKLRSLFGGTIWPLLKERYLAPLRSGATAILTWNAALERDTVVVRDTVVMAAPTLFPVIPPVASAIEQAPATGLNTLPTTGAMMLPQLKPHKPKLRYPVWIMRTNLLMLGVGTPNLQLEWSLGHKDKWSLNVEGAWSWWTFARNAYANEVIYGSVELRRWLGRRWLRHTLSGWHIGLAAGAGYGDVEWKSKGYQGEVYSGFLNIGYQARFGRRKQWAFDAGIGLGYVYAPYRRYDGSTLFPKGREEQYDDHLMWQETSRANWIGTPHVNISIGYVFNQKNATWRRRKANQRDAVRNAVLHHRDSLIAHERYQRDSLKVANKLRVKEIELLPKAERRAAKKQLEAEKKQQKIDLRQAHKESKQNAKMQKQLAKINARQQKHAARLERDSIQRTLSEGKRYWKQMSRAEQRKIKQEIKFEKLLEERRGKSERKQAKIDRKLERIRSKIDAEYQKHLERRRYEMEKADIKYNIK